MAYFDLELNMLDGLSVDAGGVGSNNRLYLDRIILNGDTNDMVTFCELDSNGNLKTVKRGTYDGTVMRTTYVFTVPAIKPPLMVYPTAFLTAQPVNEMNTFLNKMTGWDKTLVFKTFKFPDDLPINYQPQIDDQENRIELIENTPDGGNWGGFNTLTYGSLILNGDTRNVVSVKITPSGEDAVTLIGTYQSNLDITIYTLNTIVTDPWHFKGVLTVTATKNGGSRTGKQYLYFSLPEDFSNDFQPQIDTLDARMDTAETNIDDLQEQINQIEQQAGVIDAFDFSNADLRGSFGQLSLTKYALDYFYGTSATPAIVTWGVTGSDTVQSFIGYNGAISTDLNLIVSLCDIAPVVGSYIASKPQKGVVKCIATDGSTATCIVTDMDDLYWQGTFTAPNFTGTGTIFEEVNNGIKVTNINDQSSWELNNIVKNSNRNFTWAYTGNGNMAASDGDTLGIVKGVGDVGTKNGTMYYKPRHKELVQRIYPSGNSIIIDTNGDTSGTTDNATDKTVFAIFDYAGGAFDMATGSVTQSGDWTRYTIPRTDDNGNTLTQIALAINTTHGYGNKYIWIWRPLDSIATSDIPGMVKSDTADMDGIKAFTVDGGGNVAITPYQNVNNFDPANLDSFAFVSPNAYTSDIVKQAVGKILGLINGINDIGDDLSNRPAMGYFSYGIVNGRGLCILKGDYTDGTLYPITLYVLDEITGAISSTSIYDEGRSFNSELQATLVALPSSIGRIVNAILGIRKSSIIVPIATCDTFFIERNKSSLPLLATSAYLGMVRYGNEFQNNPQTSALELKPGSVDWSKFTHLPPWTVLANITGSINAPISAVGMTQLSSALTDPAKNSIPIADRSWVTNQLLPFNQYKNAYPNPTAVVTQTTEDAIDKLTLVNNENYSDVPLDRAVASVQLLLQLIGQASNATAVQKIVSGQPQLISQLLYNTVVGVHPVENSIYSAIAVYDKFQSVAQQFYNIASELQALEGRGGYLQHHDFGTDTPTQISLNTYAADYIWGDGSFTTGDGSGSSDVWTVTSSGAAHTLIEIFNATRVKNDNNNNTWELANTSDTNPPVFDWINTGSDGVSIATEITAGTVRASQSSDISVDNTTGDMSIRDGVISQSKLASSFNIATNQMPNYDPKTVLANTSQQTQKPQARTYNELIDELSTYHNGWNTNPVATQAQLSSQINAVNAEIDEKSTVYSGGSSVENLNVQSAYNVNGGNNVYDCNYINNLYIGGGGVNPYDGAFTSFTPDTAIFINGQQSAELQVGSYFGTPLFARTLKFDFGGTPQQQTNYILKTLTDADVLVKFEGCLYNTSTNGGNQYQTTTPIGIYPVYNSAENITMSLCKQPQGKIVLYCINVNLQNTSYSDWHGAITFYYTKNQPFS
ncbi:hypothetical protein FACS1894132_05810 [Clostridia bacterium]|nr:hypothetical protein FACS1894132_05810 [Clostridia bacterium]